MSFALGIDLSTVNVDYVLLSEDSNEAAWSRYTPAGETAYERLRNLPAILPPTSFYDGCYIAAVEVPYGRNQPGTSAKLNRVFGAVLACIPQCLEVWAVGAAEWKKALGLKAKPTQADIKRLAGYAVINTTTITINPADWQNARDAYCIALWARETNRRAIEAAA